MRRRNVTAEEVRRRVPRRGGDDRSGDGQADPEVARDLGVGAGTLGNWVHKERLARGDGPDHTRIDAAYVRRLERENAELRMERDVLTRSVVLWVQEATR
jgi:transposase-like protein